MKGLLYFLGAAVMVLTALGTVLAVNATGRWPAEAIGAGLGGGLALLWMAAVLDRLEAIAERLRSAAKPEAPELYGQAAPGIAAGPALTPEQTQAAVAEMRAALPEKR